MTRVANRPSAVENASHGIDWLAVVRTNLDVALRDLPVEALPDLIGTLAAASARATLRLGSSSMSAQTGSETMVTAKQIAKEFNVPTGQIYELARQERLPHVRAGKYVRFDPAEVRRALTSGESSKTPSLRPKKTVKKRSNGAALQAPATTATALQPFSPDHEKQAGTR
jgi:excisionase family DNA binding protein